jgi:hypothetical protein
VLPDAPLHRHALSIKPVEKWTDVMFFFLAQDKLVRGLSLGAVK